jgi:hypothetical protein
MKRKSKSKSKIKTGTETETKTEIKPNSKTETETKTIHHHHHHHHTDLCDDNPIQFLRRDCSRDIALAESMNSIRNAGENSTGLTLAVSDEEERTKYFVKKKNNLRMKTETETNQEVYTRIK